MRVILWSLWALTCAAHGAKEVVLEPVFEKSDNGIFTRGKEVHFGFSLKNQTKKQLDLEVVWEVASDQKKPVVQSDPIRLKIPAGEKRISRYSAKISEAGFYKGTLAFAWPGGRGKQTVQVGYAPEDILPPLTKEADFQKFWDGSRSRLAKVDPRYRLIHQPKLSKGPNDVYEVRMRSYGDVRIGGWYEVPKSKGPHPALIRVPGYGGNMKPVDLFDDLIVFSFNPRGHGNSQQDVEGRPRDYWIRGLDDKEGYYYQGAYLDCVRAVDFLCSREEVDPGRIAVKGGSQGGGLSFSTAALDQRISLCIPHIPFLTNWELYFKTSHWPEMDRWIEGKESRTWKSTLQTLSYFDTMNMAPWIECPVFMGVGLQDSICPPVTNFAVYNRLKGKREFLVYPEAKHYVNKEFHPLALNWMRKHFGLNPVP
jgi:cephalosporin-C deacetylase-like acetyl esterase